MMIKLYILAFFLTYIGYPVVIKFLIKYQLVAKNHSGNTIPFGYGLLLLINSIIIFIVGTLFDIYSMQLSLSFLFLLLVVGLVGLVDDYFGDKQDRGFRGHFGKFFSEFSVTTGFLKVVLISAAVFLIVIKLRNNLLLLMVDFLLIVLMTNFINLLDLRPGRALKGFLIVTVVSFLGTNPIFIKLILPFLLMVLILLPVDLKAKAMLGDIGANLLGAFLGLSLVFSLNFFYKVILVLMLILIHIYTEKFSLTELIAKNRILNYIDRLGRNKV